MPRILSVSFDASLLQTRHLLLREAGYDVVSVLGYAQAIAACSNHFNLVIMGHSIPKKDKQSIVAVLRERGCYAPVVSLIGHAEQPIPEAARAIEPDPQCVLETVASLLGGSHSSDAALLE